MKILMVNYEWPPLGGGGGVAMREVAIELSRNHQVHILTSGTEGLPEKEVCEQGNLEIHRCRVLFRNSNSTASVPSMLSFYPYGIQRGRRLLDENQYDLINTWFAIPSGPIGSHLARRRRLPHVLSVMGGDIYDPSKWYSPHRNPLLGRTVRRVLGQADRLTTISTDLADRARGIYGYGRSIDVIPLGLKLPQHPDYTREALGLHDHQVVLVTVGRLVARKANDQLIRILARLRDPNVVLVILGDGPQRGVLQELARELNVEQQVIMPGFVDEDQKYRYLQASDIFVSTTSHEGFGLMYVEAMFCGLPIVTYDRGGQRDFLADGKTGMLIPLNDESAFQKALEQLIHEPTLRKVMGDFNLDRAQQFTIGHSASRYEQVFRSVISQK